MSWYAVCDIGISWSYHCLWGSVIGPCNHLDGKERVGCFTLISGSVVVDFLFIVTPIVGVCNCSMFCCTLLYVNSSIAIILMGMRELVALLNLSSWCLAMV